MGRDANGHAQLQHTNVKSHLCWKTSLEKSACLPWQYHYLVQLTCWAQNQCSHTRGTPESGIVLLTQKVLFFCYRNWFLGTPHFHMWHRGGQLESEADPRMAGTSAKHVWQFLGLVRYISTFLPMLTEHTSMLTPLTCKECNTAFPIWTVEHQHVFDSLKCLVVSCDCLTTIDHKNPGDNKIVIKQTMDRCCALFWAYLGIHPACGIWEQATEQCRM